LLLVASLSLTAFAFAQRSTSTITTAQRSTQALERLQSEVPGVQVLRKGVKVSRVYGVPFGSGFTPEQSAVAFANEYSEIFEPGMASLVYTGSQDVMDGKFTAVYFTEAVNGVTVDKGVLTVLVKNVVGSPIVLASSSVETVTTMGRAFNQMSGSEAQKIVKRANPGLSAETAPVMVGWQGETQTHYAWSFVVSNGKPEDPKRFKVFVDASNGKILEWRDEVFFVDVTGNVKGWATPGILPNQPSNPSVLQNLVNATARVVGGNSALTNGSGNFTITHPGNVAVDVQSLLIGTWANVINSAGASEVLTMNVTPPGPANFIFNAAKTEFVQSQVDGLIQTNAVHNFAKAINGSYPGIDISIPTTVNLNSSCNAYYSASTINFYRAGGGCPNMAYSTVVHHEYGHFIIDKGHPAPSGDYHEGIADVTAAMLSNDPCLARDFFGPNTGCLRNSYNSMMHPCGGGSHDCGQVVSGAFWLTKDELDATIGAGPALTLSRSLYLNSILLHPSDIDPGVTIDVLTLDDNDGNIFNGTPHYTEIAEGFGAKNLDAPALNWLTITPANVPGEFIQLPHSSVIRPVSVTIQNVVGTQDPNSVRLVYRLNGGAWIERVMGIPSPGAPYTSFLSIPPAGTIVEWYVKASDMDGHIVTWPAGDPRVTMFGNSLTTTVLDTFENNLGWTVVNDPSLLSGGWTRANPNGTFLGADACNPENDSSDAGGFCAFTGQAAVGGGAGDQDVDGGPTRFLSPIFDLSGSNGVVDLSRWFYNDDGDDSMTIELSNNGGTSWTLVKSYMYTGSENSWATAYILVGNIMPRTNNMRVRVSTSDNPNNSITEAAIDAFRVRRLQ
jgi:hypothetical protein